MIAVRLDARGKTLRLPSVPNGVLQLVELARAASLEPKRLRFVHGKADRPARVALIELAFAKAGGLVVDTPLVETGADGRPTQEIARLMRS